MRIKLLAAITVAVLLVATDASEPKKHKLRKFRDRSQASADPFGYEDEYLEKTSATGGSCLKKYCGAGRECRIDENGIAVCDCISHCPTETDPRRMVCSNYNETWNSDCALHRMRCLCKKGSEQCTDERYDHSHIDYYGECQQLPECTPELMVDFPRRMRDWLFNVMRDLADRKELSDYYTNLERETEKDLTRKWANAAIWKFCDLDGNPPDRRVSRHELFPIRAPLMAMEQCIGPFLDTCDTNDDHFISLKGWGKCLELDEADLENKCERVRQ